MKKIECPYNVFPLKSMSPFKESYMILDTKEEFSDSVLKDLKVKAIVYKEMMDKDEVHVLLFVNIRKKDRDVFMTAMEKVAEHFETSDEEYEKRCKEIESLLYADEEDSEDDKDQNEIEDALEDEK